MASLSFKLGLRGGWGGKCTSPERVRNCHSCYGTLREPRMPNSALVPLYNQALEIYYEVDTVWISIRGLIIFENFGGTFLFKVLKFIKLRNLVSTSCSSSAFPNFIFKI